MRCFSGAEAYVPVISENSPSAIAFGNVFWLLAIIVYIDALLFPIEIEARLTRAAPTGSCVGQETATVTAR